MGVEDVERVDRADRASRTKLVTRRLAASVEGLMAELARELVWGFWEVNPRDTLHSSKNWHVSFGGRRDEVDGSKKSPSDAMQKESIGHLDSYRLDYGDIHVTNNVDYVGNQDDDGNPGLNAGWSPQAQAGWIERAIKATVAQAATIYQGVLFRVRTR